MKREKKKTSRCQKGGVKRAIVGENRKIPKQETNKTNQVHNPGNRIEQGGEQSRDYDTDTMVPFFLSSLPFL